MSLHEEPRPMGGQPLWVVPLRAQALAYWRLVAVFVVTVLVGVIFAWRLQVALNQVQATAARQCATTNATADVWNLLITQNIAAERHSTTDSATVKARKIHDLLQIKFPHQEC